MYFVYGLAWNYIISFPIWRQIRFLAPSQPIWLRAIAIPQSVCPSVRPSVRFSLIDQKLLKLRGSELRRIWHLLGYLYSAEDYAYIVTLWGLCCAEDNVKATMWKDVVWMVLWKRHCEKDVVRKTLWERRLDEDVLRKTLWERYLFCPPSFDRQTFVINDVLHMLEALHL